MLLEYNSSSLTNTEEMLDTSTCCHLHIAYIEMVTDRRPVWGQDCLWSLITHLGNNVTTVQILWPKKKPKMPPFLMAGP